MNFNKIQLKEKREEQLQDWKDLEKDKTAIERSIGLKESLAIHDKTNLTLKTELQKLREDLDEIVDKLSTKQTEITLVKVELDNRVLNHATKSSTKSKMVSPVSPQMGGLMDTRDGKEAWTRRKPSSIWFGLDVAASKILISTQIVLNNSNAAVAMIKHTKGLYTEEATEFKHN